jgi:hypothetical protein
MTALGGPCEHCPNPHKELWTTQCMFEQQLKIGGWTDEQVHDYRMSGSDNPCSMDAYDAEVTAQVKHDERNVVWIFLLLVAVPVLLYCIG